MLTLILGGARSGKSDLALRLAGATGGEVVFIATMEPGDDELRARIESHRAARPAVWRTVEAPIEVAAAVRDAAAGETIVIDCITLWLTNLLGARVGEADTVPVEHARQASADIADIVDELVDVACAFAGDVIVVSNEVGLGVVPP